MIAKVILVFALVGAIAETHSACINCGLGPGKDVCSAKNCAQMIVRPVKLPKMDPSELCKPKVVCHQVGGIAPFKPIGDLCSCNRAIVKPAMVPKPACALCQGPMALAAAMATSAASSASSSSAASSSYYQQSGPSDPTSVVIDIQGGSASGASSMASASAAAVDEYGVPIAPRVPPGLVVADPVSLALAYSLQNNINKVSEDKLSFGFRTMPKEVEICKTVKPVFPEENLYGIRGQIVEMKPVAKPSDPTSMDEEAIEALIEAEEEEQENLAHMKKLTYNEIGFGPAQVKEVPYIKVEGQVDTGSVGSQTSCGAASCNDGYVSGSVDVEPMRKHHISFETMSDPAYMEDDDDVDDLDDEEIAESGLIRLPYPMYSSSSCRSSSCASCSKTRHNIVVETLKCS